jgi:hypothetical protein
MRISNGGNVGIGTTSPTNGKLVVKSGESNSTGIVLERGSNTDKLVNIYSETADGIIAIASGANTKIFLNSVGNSYFTGGNVGIGTTSPGAQLSIFDTNNTRAYQMSFGYSSTETFRLGNHNTTGKFTFTQLNNNNGFRFTSSAPNAQGIIFDINTSQFVVNGDTGRVGIGRTPTANILEVGGDASKTTAGDWLANSDSTIKTEIHTIDGALDRINKVRLVSFKYKDEYKLLNPSIKDKFYQNVIAQEYQEIYPDYVYQSGDIFEDKNILQVDTNPMYIDAVASIQQLSAQIDILKQEIINLKTN